MDIKPFGVEIWMDLYETKCQYNIAETCVDSLSLEELEALLGIEGTISDILMKKRLTYGEIPGREDFRKGVASLYKNVEPKNVLSTNGAVGANFLGLFSLVAPGDEVVTFIPTYQQHYSIPESIGATVKLVSLRKEEGFLPNIEVLKATVTEKTKLICINNPNNPTGALMDEKVLKEIVEVAKSVGAYVLSDEAYRHLNQAEGYYPSIVDIYDKGISTGSMSKVFSMAGLRMGWIVAPEEVIEKAYDIRHYNMISCGMIDETIAAIALAHKDKILQRNLGIIRKNIEVLDQWIRLEPHIEYVKPSAGTTALLYYDMAIESSEFCRQVLKETGVMIVPGSCFEMDQCFRIGYAFNTAELEKGLEVFGKYLRKFD